MSRLIFMTGFHQFLQALRQPEYVHVLLNPLPVYGLAMGLIGLVFALLLKSRPAQLVALLIVLIAAASAWPVAEFGEQGYDRVYSMAYKEGQQWLEVHAYRAHRGVYVFYVTAVVALAAMVLPWKLPHTKTPLLALTLVLVVASLAVGAWISRAGGQIRHKEFREGPPPSVPKPSES